jgi:predicted phage tail protein
MAEIILRRSRTSLDVSFKADATAMDLAIGDLVNITHATPAFSAKPFRVQGMTINADHSVSLQCTEHQDSFYTFGTQQEVATIPDTTLPNPFSVLPPASITLTDELIEYADGIVITRLLITIGASTDLFVDNYEVQIKQTLDPDGNAVSDDFREIAVGKILQYQHLNVIDGATYQVRVRAVNTIGSKSTFISTTRAIVGGVEPPSNVEDFAVELHGQDHLKLTWTPPTANSDLDISFYEIRFQNVTTGANWINSTNLVRCPRRKCDNAIVPARVGSYLIKAVDKNGNSSAEATIVTTNVSAIQAYKQISTFTETPNVLTALDQMDTSFPLTVKIDPSGDTILSLERKRKQTLMIQ